MPTTAIINRRRRSNRSRRKPAVSVTRRRRRNPRSYGAAVRTENRRRRKTTTRRRRNPAAAPQVSVRSAYSSAGYRRRPNPSTGIGMFDLDALMQIGPAAGLGMGAARWATKLAGEMDAEGPGFKHAIAIYLAASVGGDVIGSALGDNMKGLYAAIASIGFGVDLFARKRFLKDSEWAEQNLYLDGFQASSALGQQYTDAAGNQWVLTQGGWQLAGYSLPADTNTSAGSQLAGFQETSDLGARRSRHNAASSFGYSV